MCHKNKNDILDYFYNLDEPQKRLKVHLHIQECDECKSYLDTLISTGEKLDTINNELPVINTFDLIESKIDEVPQVVSVKKKELELIPVVKILMTMMFILLGLYFLQSKIEFLEIWNQIENSWLVDTFGKYSFVVILFFAIGSMISLIFAPIIYLQSSKGKRIIFK